MKKAYPIFGILAPFFYIFTVIIGGFILSGYNHFYNTISEITAVNNLIIQIPIVLYNIFIAFFGLGAFLYLKTKYRTKIKIASSMLIGVGVIGIIMYFFPQDPRNIEMTFNGKIHIILAGLASLLTIVSIVIAGMGFKDDVIYKMFRIYSYVSVAIIFVTGGLAAASVANDSAVGGLFERLTIGTFLQWVFVIAIKLFLIDSKNTIIHEKSNREIKDVN